MRPFEWSSDVTTASSTPSAVIASRMTSSERIGLVDRSICVTTMAARNRSGGSATDPSSAMSRTSTSHPRRRANSGSGWPGSTTARSGEGPSTGLGTDGAARRSTAFSNASLKSCVAESAVDGGSAGPPLPDGELLFSSAKGAARDSLQFRHRRTRTRSTVNECAQSLKPHSGQSTTAGGAVTAGRSDVRQPPCRRSSRSSCGPRTAWRPGRSSTATPAGGSSCREWCARTTASIICGRG